MLFARTDRYMTSRIEKSESVLLDQDDVKEFTTKQKEFKFSIYRVPFNEGKGGLSVPVNGASGNNRSNFFAKYSPPVFLENMAFETRAANIPEFFDNRAFNLSSMTDDFSDNAMYHNRLATESIKQHEYNDAQNSLKKAIGADSTYYDAYKNQFYLNLILGRSKSKEDMSYREIARRLIDRQIMQNPGEYPYYYFRSGIRSQMGDKAGAVSDLKTSADLLKIQQSKRKLEKAESDLLSSIQKQLKNNPF